MFRTILVILLLLIIGVLAYVSFGYYSKGERAGTISKLSEKGYIFKTHEGVLNEGGYSGETGTLTPRYWDFSTSQDSVVVKLQQAMQTGERVTLTYHEKFFQFPWNGDTKYFIIDVTFLPQRYSPSPQVPQPQAAPALPPPPPAQLPADTARVI